MVGFSRFRRCYMTRVTAARCSRARVLYARITLHLSCFTFRRFFLPRYRLLTIAERGSRLRAVAEVVAGKTYGSYSPLHPAFFFTTHRKASARSRDEALCTFVVTRTLPANNSGSRENKAKSTCDSEIKINSKHYPNRPLHGRHPTKRVFHIA